MAQDFVYKPKNPAFGGDTFNATWLLNNAAAQDTYKDPAASNSRTSSSAQRDPLQEFSDNLQRTIFNQLSRNLGQSQANDLGDLSQGGTYIIGNYQIESYPAATGITILITDLNTGATTQVIIPN